MRAQTLWLCGEGRGHGLVRWETRRCHGSAVPVLLIKLPSACGHHVPARPPKCPLLIHESTPHMWLSLASSEALRHERWGKYCLCLNTQLSTKPLPRFPSGSVPLKKKKKLRHRYTMLWNINSHCCSLPTAGKRAMRVMWVCVGVCVGVGVWAHLCICVRMCTHVLSPFALVFYKCGGGGCVLSRHSVWIYYEQTRCCFGTGCLYIWWASCFYLHSTDVLSKACVGRAAF